MEKLKIAKEKYGDLKIYLSIDYETKCGECGELQSHIKDGFANFTHVINRGKFFNINAEEEI